MFNGNVHASSLSSNKCHPCLFRKQTNNAELIGVGATNATLRRTNCRLNLILHDEQFYISSGGYHLQLCAYSGLDEDG